MRKVSEIFEKLFLSMEIYISDNAFNPRKTFEGKDERLHHERSLFSIIKHLNIE
jgi:hypothetical protein